MHGTGNSSTRTLNINRECEPISSKHIDITDSPDLVNTILKNLRLENVNHLICAQLNINCENSTCIDLILTNRPRSFQDSTVVETGLSDFRKMCVTVMKMYHCRQRPSVITYRKFKKFSNIEFMPDLEEHLTKFEHFDNIPSNLFKETVNIILEKHAPTKKKYVRSNQGLFITKTLSKAIMKTSRLRNKFLNTKSNIHRKVYNKQRNYVVSLLRKGKKGFLW